MGANGGRQFAVKSINDKTLHTHGLDMAAVQKEVGVLTRLSHPHVVRFISFMSEARHFMDQDGEACEVSTGVVFIMNTIPPQGIGAVCIISEGKAPIPCGKSYS